MTRLDADTVLTPELSLLNSQQDLFKVLVKFRRLNKMSLCLQRVSDSTLK